MRILFIVSVSVLIIVALFWTRPDTYAELQSLPPPTVNVDIVDQIDIQPVTQVTGKLQPARKASLHFQVSGQIDGRFVEAGQYIEVNSRMLSIEAGDFVDAVEESKALLKTERNAIERDSRLLDLMRLERELQDQEVRRLKQLGQDSLASKSIYDQARQALYRQQADETRLKHSVDSARSRLMVDQARLNKAERNLKRTQLISPFNGTINAVHVEVGDYVSPGQVALEIVQIDKLDLNLEVPGITASQLKLGQKITVVTNNDERVGQIIALAVDPDPETNTHSLKIRLPSAGLFSGRLAVAHLPGHFYKDAHVIPISAILYEDGQSYVFVVIDDHVVKTLVKLVERYNDIQIIAGIKPGATIIGRDVSSLADGQAVVVH
ncbi:MAG: efflux RND transporter periplasmic adaptor subunit [Proteobacteria bacterium]|nr:efflux RND transporter periplasmic adaptor subunit [Pseudomonadota bacterium]